MKPMEISIPAHPLGTCQYVYLWTASGKKTSSTFTIEMVPLHINRAAVKIKHDTKMRTQTVGEENNMNREDKHVQEEYICVICLCLQAFLIPASPDLMEGI